MKRIRLLSLPDPRFAVGDPQYEANRVDYRAIIEQAIRMPLDRNVGATIDEMRKGIRVLDALDAATAIGAETDAVLELEDADWEHLKHKVEKMPWVMVDRRLVQFYDDIIGATDAVRDPARANSVA
ncbi:MAG TPA: hypothetical protein VFB50_01070 [Chloroflexota bacterium]|nr:hypothetical protein [Chloroflexota bacterium]